MSDAYRIDKTALLSMAKFVNSYYIVEGERTG